MPRIQDSSAGDLYEAAKRFSEAALGEQPGSLFNPGQPLWTISTCKTLDERFVQAPDRSEATFDAKLKKQLQDSGSLIIQAAGELIFFHLLTTAHLLPNTKKSLVDKVLSWSPDSIVIPEQLQKAYNTGLANPGTAFNTRRPEQLWFLIKFIIAWKLKPVGDQRQMISDPWSFKKMVFENSIPWAQTQQHALLHLIFPDIFEPIVSQTHKQNIVDRFKEYIHQGTPDDQDRQLQDIRKHLEGIYGPNFSYYKQDIKKLWLPEGKIEKTEPIEVMPTSLCRFWMEKTLVEGRPDRLAGPDRLGTALWSPQRGATGRDIYKLMREVKPGDIVFHFVDNKRISGISKVIGLPDDTFVGISETDWAGAPAIRVPLDGYVTLSPAIERDLIFENESIHESLKAILEHNKGLFFNKDLELNQGSYLTELPIDLVTIFNTLYKDQTGHDLPHIELVYSLPPSALEVSETGQSNLTMEWLLKETLLRQEQLEEFLESIRSKCPQIVLAGPPGTSKTWIAKALLKYLTQDLPESMAIVQLHPSYSYEDFMEGLRPVVKDGVIHFTTVPGKVVAFADSIRGKGKPAGMILDEMNRANLPRVMGELMYLLEYREEKVDLPYRKQFSLPNELFFIGTMNTADRSIRSIDLALRRRFDFFELQPDVTVLQRYYENEKVNQVDDLLEGFIALNKALSEQLDRHYSIGHTFFMANPMTFKTLKRVWKYKIYPLLEEYFYDQLDILQEFKPERFWKGAWD